MQREKGCKAHTTLENLVRPITNEEAETAVQNEIARLREYDKSWFSIKCDYKANLIQDALDTAREAGADIATDEGIKDALAYHRIFGFFGTKKADALVNFEDAC